MRFLRILPLGMLELLVNQGLALGFTFAVIILLRPLTNRLLRPRYRVVFWLAGWVLGWGASFYRMLGEIRLLPVTFRGWITPQAQGREGLPAYFPDMEQAGDYAVSLPGGVEFPFSVTDGMLNLLALLTVLGFAVLIWWGTREENRLRTLSRRGDPMDEEWHRARGIDPEAVKVRIMPDLPTSYVCRISPGVHYVCLQKELPPEQMELVLKHELAHIRGSHVWGKGLVMSLLLLYWWNPIMWAAYRLVSRDMELACDEAVLAGLEEEERRTYARTLVELGAGKHLWGGLTCFGECDAEIRVRCAVRWKREPVWMGALVWPALILAFLFLFTMPQEARAERESRWDDFVRSPMLTEQVQKSLNDPELSIEELWEREGAVLGRMNNDRWYLFGFKWYSNEGRYRCNSWSSLGVEPKTSGMTQVEPYPGVDDP